MCFLTRNLKFNIFNDGSKGVSNESREVICFPAWEHHLEGVSLSNLWASHKCNVLNLKPLGGETQLKRNVVEKMLEAIPNDAMTRHAKSHVLEPKPMHDIKQT